MIRAVITAFAFLTRFPTPALATITDRDLGAAVAYFPLVGLVLGLLVAGAGYLTVGHLPAAVAAGLLVALLAAATGGLHLDGLCDLFDGLGGGRGNRERTLEIMRDSRIGAHGAAALILVLLAKTAAVGALLEKGDFWALLCFPLVARWAVAPQIVCFPYARAEGLGAGFKRQAGPVALVIGSAIAAAALLVGQLTAGQPMAMSALREAAVSLLTSLIMAAWLRTRLGGLTGDVYGATIEICETVAVSAALLR